MASRLSRQKRERLRRALSSVGHLEQMTPDLLFDPKGASAPRRLHLLDPLNSTSVRGAILGLCMGPNGRFRLLHAENRVDTVPLRATKSQTPPPDPRIHHA